MESLYYAKYPVEASPTRLSTKAQTLYECPQSVCAVRGGNAGACRLLAKPGYELLQAYRLLGISKGPGHSDLGLGFGAFSGFSLSSSFRGRFGASRYTTGDLKSELCAPNAPTVCGAQPRKSTSPQHKAQDGLRKPE